MAKDNEDLTSKIHKFLDDNIRFIQYPTYALGVVGLGMIVKSLYLFSKFTSARSIPQEFVRKGVSLRGRVLGITPSKKLVNTISDFHHVDLKLDHVPIATLTLRKYSSKNLMADALNIELAGVQVNAEGMLEIHRLIPQESAVWFKLYGIDVDHNAVYASIFLKPTWKKFWRSQDLAVVLLKEKQAMVSPLIQQPSILYNSMYSKYYRHLLFCEARARRKKRFAWIRGIWSKDSSIKRKAS